MGIDATSSAAREDDPLASAKGDDSDKGPERAGRTQADTNDDRSHQRAETRTREEYADARRAGDPPASLDHSRDYREAPEEGHQGRPDGRADHDRAEPRDRETYANEIRADHSSGDRQEPTAAMHPDRPAGTSPDPPPAANGHRTDQAREDHEATWTQAAEAPTLADADRAGTSDRSDETEPVSHAERPAGDRPDDRVASADQATSSAHHQQETGHRPETITFDNKDIEVTHNAADGIWIEGLPGEPPKRIGDIVTSPEETGRSRIENLRQELNKDADDLVDMGGKWTDLIRDSFGTPPPTNSITHSRGPEMTATRPDHGINAGHGAEAFLTVAIVGAAAIHKLHERLQRAWHD